MRNLVLILGDQLDVDSAVFDDFDPASDAVWMAEVTAESTHVWSHKARIALFLAAMRHFRAALADRGFTVHYTSLDAAENHGTLAAQLRADIHRLHPDRLVMTHAGEYRVRESLTTAAADLGLELEVRPDRHFLCTPDEFDRHARGRKQLRMEYFYRDMRRRHDVLMEGDDPVGGQWNYDKQNRRAFKKSSPPDVPPPKHFPPDDLTTDVLALVEKNFPDHPGSLEHFDWPVTLADAQAALDDFIEHRLPHFGDYQDAMWTGEPYLYHSRISAALNLKLLDPRHVIAAAEAAYHAGQAPLNAVEGFIRQILGWREYVRGIYWRFMPDYLDRNALDADAPLPDFYWTADTDMHCLAQAVGQTLDFGYAHHIQRLMVTGLFALLLGVDPRAVHEWYLAVYVDAVEWVELPNSLGMSQFADGGVMASKPYVATGKYINRMSNYCAHCRYHPDHATGADACPFTTLYWDFLDRHRDTLEKNQRMTLQVKNLDRKSRDEMQQIRDRAAALRTRFA